MPVAIDMRFIPEVVSKFYLAVHKRSYRDKVKTSVPEVPERCQLGARMVSTEGLRAMRRYNP